VRVWEERARGLMVTAGHRLIGERSPQQANARGDQEGLPLARWSGASRAYFQRWLVIGALIGVVAGIGSIVFFWAIDIATKFFLGLGAGYYPPGPAGEGATVIRPIAHLWMIPVITTLGGLLTGLIVYTFAPEAEGHGTDAAIEAFHEKGGKIRARIPPIKLIASAITIGSGGSAGREGPTAQIAAGFGSWLGDLLHLNDEDRRIAVAAGVGAGIGSIFKAPFGGALLSGEILYKRDFEAAALFPAFIASVVGFSIYGAWAGWTPVFGTGGHYPFNEPRSLLGYLILGIVCGTVGLLYPTALYGIRDLFHRIHIPNHFKPAIGGLLVGLIGLFVPQALGMGYGYAQFGINGNFLAISAWVMLIIAFVKIVTTALTIGTGGSGGVFGPGMVIGGFLGGALWSGLHTVAPWTLGNTQPGAFAVVGMGAFFGGVGKAPLAVILMVAEMTGEYSLIVPAMLATMVAYLITGETSIYESQVDTRLDSPAHKDDFALPLLQSMTVRQAMEPARAVATPNTPLTDISRIMRENRVASVLILQDGNLIGLITSTDMAQVPPDSTHITRARQIMSRRLVRAYPDESLYQAWLRMTRRGLRQLAVVERGEERALLGVVTLAAIGRMLRVPLTAVAGQAAGQPEPAVANAARRATQSSSDGVADMREVGHTVPVNTSRDGQASAIHERNVSADDEQVEEDEHEQENEVSMLTPGPGSRTAPLAIGRKEQVVGDGAAVDPLEQITVAEAMFTSPRLVTETEPLPSVVERLDDHGRALMVVNAAGELVGIVTRADLHGRAVVEGGKALTAGDVAVRRLVTAQPDETLRAAVRRMSRLGIRQLPVVPQGSTKPAGLLRRSDIMEAYARQIGEDVTGPRATTARVRGAR
jgi:chloride channel protein, CIC family